MDFISLTSIPKPKSASGIAGGVPPRCRSRVGIIWLSGGLSQIDTFDPKLRGNPKASPKVAGSDYASIDTAVPGMKFCEHLHGTAPLAECMTAIRSMNHHVIDKTLVVVGSEFGRPGSFGGRGGRGHQGSCFSMILAGGGLKHSGAYGTTDEQSKTIEAGPVSIPDFHATIHAAMGIDLHRQLFDGSRPVPTTDGGTPIAALF